MTDKIRTRSQKYAQIIYNQVVKVQHNPQLKAYERLAKELPILIKQSGLAQALCFAHAKAKSKDKSEDKSMTGDGLLLKDLETSIRNITGKDIELLNEAINAPLTDYVRLTHEVMTALQWYKRFSEAFSKEQGNSIQGGGDEKKGS